MAFRFTALRSIIFCWSLLITISLRTFVWTHSIDSSSLPPSSPSSSSASSSVSSLPLSDPSSSSPSSLSKQALLPPLIPSSLIILSKNPNTSLSSLSSSFDQNELDDERVEDGQKKFDENELNQLIYKLGRIYLRKIKERDSFPQSIESLRNEENFDRTNADEQDYLHLHDMISNKDISRPDAITDLEIKNEQLENKLRAVESSGIEQLPYESSLSSSSIFTPALDFHFASLSQSLSLDDSNPREKETSSAIPTDDSSSFTPTQSSTSMPLAQTLLSTISVPSNSQQTQTTKNLQLLSSSSQTIPSSSSTSMTEILSIIETRLDKLQEDIFHLRTMMNYGFQSNQPINLMSFIKAQFLNMENILEQRISSFKQKSFNVKIEDGIWRKTTHWKLEELASKILELESKNSFNNVQVINKLDLIEQNYKVIANDLFGKFFSINDKMNKFDLTIQTKFNEIDSKLTKSIDYQQQILNFLRQDLDASHFDTGSFSMMNEQFISNLDHFESKPIDAQIPSPISPSIGLLVRDQWLMKKLASVGVNGGQIGTKNHTEYPSNSVENSESIIDFESIIKDSPQSKQPVHFQSQQQHRSTTAPNQSFFSITQREHGPQSHQTGGNYPKESMEISPTTTTTILATSSLPIMVLSRNQTAFNRVDLSERLKINQTKPTGVIEGDKKLQQLSNAQDAAIQCKWILQHWKQTRRLSSDDSELLLSICRELLSIESKGVLFLSNGSFQNKNIHSKGQSSHQSLRSPTTTQTKQQQQPILLKNDQQKQPIQTNFDYDSVMMKSRPASIPSSSSSLPPSLSSPQSVNRQSFSQNSPNPVTLAQAQQNSLPNNDEIIVQKLKSNLNKPETNDEKNNLIESINQMNGELNQKLEDLDNKFLFFSTKIIKIVQEMWKSSQSTNYHLKETLDIANHTESLIKTEFNRLKQTMRFLEQLNRIDEKIREPLMTRMQEITSALNNSVEVILNTQSQFILRQDEQSYKILEIFVNEIRNRSLILSKKIQEQNSVMNRRFEQINSNLNQSGRKMIDEISEENLKLFDRFQNELFDLKLMIGRRQQQQQQNSKQSTLLFNDLESSYATIADVNNDIKSEIKSDGRQKCQNECFINRKEFENICFNIESKPFRFSRENINVNLGGLTVDAAESDGIEIGPGTLLETNPSPSTPLSLKQSIQSSASSSSSSPSSSLSSSQPSSPLAAVLATSPNVLKTNNPNTITENEPLSSQSAAKSSKEFLDHLLHHHLNHQNEHQSLFQQEQEQQTNQKEQLHGKQEQKQQQQQKNISEIEINNGNSNDDQGEESMQRFKRTIRSMMMMRRKRRENEKKQRAMMMTMMMNKENEKSIE
ncbi:hypothetical protein NH340_JMT08066 [Sarcoptes scabiei]|nr:hypothetical protein NH340_JMT08066 [Sarcoptes scabiei]